MGNEESKLDESDAAAAEATQSEPYPACDDDKDAAADEEGFTAAGALFAVLQRNKFRCRNGNNYWTINQDLQLVVEYEALVSGVEGKKRLGDLRVDG